MVAIWRNPDLESLIGGGLDPLGFTEAGIRALVDTYPEEAMQIEFKSRRDWEKETDKNNRKKDIWNVLQERAKDVCAPANSRGAVLIYGVENSGPTDGRMRPFEQGDPHKMIEQFRRDVRMWTSPHPRYDMFAVDAVAQDGATEDGFYLVAVIPPGEAAPHAVYGQGDRRSLTYFVRAEGESHIRVLSELEVAEMYARRNRTLEDRRARVAAVWSEGCDRVADYSGDIWVAASIVPAAPQDAELTRTAAREIEEWANSVTFPDSILGGFPRAIDYAYPETGMLVLTERTVVLGQAVAPVPTYCYRELHADGSGFAAICVQDGDPNVNWREIEMNSLIDAVAVATAHVVEWTTFRAGRWGDATVQAGLIGSNALAPNGVPANVRLQDWGAAMACRVVRRSPRAELLVRLDEIDSIRDRLVVSRRVAAQILQKFGVLEPAWLGEDGSVRLSQVPGPARSKASSWVARNGLTESL
ncbi:helix-turn-helix domain-containing protein [Nocardia ninae]|uniref:Schlafen AlbA-2 domain-containing protein n=1 Tax=Nocardia ninae NBRC 108245 TaxID=1210091 RepID=A0A511M5L0_9NOCA|nr:ATP-binding protein [Nocardia ninae]GEM35911.1 hypothetical protein NN4_04300 [Nocardia ninae NBRC 108245]